MAEKKPPIIIHTADLHLRDNSDERWRALLDIVQVGQKEGAQVLTISGDLFHEDVPVDFIRGVFRVMKENPQHVFQVLTKRTELALEYDRAGWLDWTDNIWLGTSVEDEQVTHRIDQLGKTGAKTKFLSCEPLIGPLPDMNLTGIDWVIVGGESGYRPRPMKPEWVIDIKDQCEAAYEIE